MSNKTNEVILFYFINYQIITELINTENKYVEKISNFIEVYIKGFEKLDVPIKQEFVNDPLIARLFCNFQQIHVINNVFYQELCKLVLFMIIIGR